MHSLETCSAKRPARRWEAPAAALLAASILLASVAPSAAFGTSNLPQAVQNQERSSFHRHFYRGMPYPSRAASTEPAEVMPVATDEDVMEQAMTYCTSRFKSYDPSTGTYLGYDGNEHACP